MNAEDHGDTPPRNALPRALSAGLFALLAALPVALSAQQAERDRRAADPQTMTVEELERYIDTQRAQLEQVRQNRDLTAERARRAREALAEKEAERREKEAELAALCRDRETIEPGTLASCLGQLDESEDR